VSTWTLIGGDDATTDEPPGMSIARAELGAWALTSEDGVQS